MGSDFFMEEVAKMEEKTDIKAKTINGKRQIFLRIF